MKLLPHYFKWIGIALFFLGLFTGAIDDGRKGFIEGYNDAIDDPSDRIEINFERILPKSITHLADFLSMAGLLIYVLSKNKREDEFMQKLRYESAFLVMVLSLTVILIFYGFNPDFKLDPSTLLSLQMIAYLIIRALKRKFILGDYEEQA
ncbi:hypothetical protein D1614_08065 [Maribellus luteus]|uniref:Uncharacterized protein n=1 Tax=Maribellus luteus TaxID=2305463 RepID=A0A399T3J0_9BACT|nr:hypothetical protein [Maribellus luteus]RIJ49484.1 hypothetical protein D1614_08065 [Maribellus luteus]